MRGTRWSGRAAAVLPALILAELLLVVPVAPAAASDTGPRQADPVPGKAIPPGTAVEAEAAPIDLSGVASADAAGVEVLSDGTRIRPRDVKYVPPAEDTEVISARSEHTTQTANKDGSFTLDASAGRLNFLDPGGVWQAIDLTLVPAGEDSFKVASNDRQVTVSTKDANDGLVEMSGGSAILHLRVPGYGRATVSDGKTIFGLSTEPIVQPDTPASSAPSPTNTVVPATSPEAEVGAAASPSASPSVQPSPSAGSSPGPSPSPPPSPSADPSPSPSPSASSAPTPSPTPVPTPTPEVPTGPIVKPDAQPLPEGTVVVEGPSGLDRITVNAVDTGFEFGAVLDAAGGSHRFTYVIEAPGLTVTLDRDGRTILLQAPQTEDGRDVMVEVGRISAPVLIDGLYMPAPDSAVVVSVEALDGGETALTYTLDETWLTDAVYPVTLDPTACIVVGGSGCTVNGSTGNYIETYAGQGNPTTYPTSPSTLRLGDDNIGSPDAAWGMLRSYLYFPPPSLFPSGTTASVVTSATLSLREDINRYGANRYLMARPLKVGWGNTSTWNDLNGKVLTGYDSPNVLTCSTGATDCTVDFDVTNAVRAHYTRRGVDWKANLGFELKMSSEGAGFWETDFYTSTNGTLSNRPKLTITYEVPKVAIDFAPTLGANYAPSSMTAGVATVLPITLTNSVSGFAFDRCTSAGDADCYQVGYRFLDQKGKTAASGQADFAADVPSAIGGANPTPVMSLAITPPSVPGTYTLRLDLIHRFGGSSGTRLYASDWAKPSAYNSRDKKVLSSDNTRWTGSSSVERDEFSVTVGSGAPGNDLKSTTTGDGGSLGIDLATRNLHYTGAGGIGFSDLVAMGVAYNYDSATAVLDCPATGAPTKYVGMLEACGWSTNWDEHFTDTSTADQSGAYTYQDPSGARSFLNTDGQGQIAGAPVLVERPRITFFDENGGGGTTATGKLYTAASQSIPTLSGPSVVRVDANADISLSAYTPTISLNTYRYLSFSMRTTSATGTAIALKIHDASNSADNPDAWLVYTVGSAWSTGFAQVDLGGTVAATWRTITNRNVYDDVRALLPGGTFDQFEIVGFVIKSKPSSSGSTYLDGMAFTPGASTVFAEPTFPTFSVNPAKAASYAEGAPGSSNSLKITPANLAGSPTCNTTTSCWLTSSGGLYANPFVAWDWRKVGGQSVAIRFDLKDLRLNSDGAGGYATGSITYYAGSTPPSDAVNPIQVSAEVPVTWTHVTRNLLEDARQVLSFYNDHPLGTSGTPPPNGPVGDDVRWTGYVLSAVDGTFALFDNLTYRSLPAASAAGSADFLATYADRSVHAFNRDGLLTSVKDRDANTVTLDYTYDTASVNSQRSYTLTAIHGPSDGGSYTRRIDISRAAGSTTFTEKLGTPGSPITGRATTFKVTSGDLAQVKPARREAACGSTPGTPSGCTGFVYDANHRLTTVSDPRWDLSSTNDPNDYRLTVDWSTGAPTKITDKSHNGASGADLIRILAWDRGTNPLGTRALWQDSPAIAAGAAIHTDLIADGRTFIDYVPVGCTSGNCLTSGNWPTDGAGIAATKRTEHEFDGLSRVNRTTAYRTPSADPVVSRQGSRAGAKVDNYVNPLLGGQLAWSQSADQLYASRVDSGNTNDDLYRTFYTYDDRGQLTHTINPVLEATPDYPRAVESATSAGTGSTNTDILGYYRLDETSGSANDANGSAVVGAHTSVVQGVASDALLPTTGNKAATYTATSSSVTVLGSFGTVSGSYTAVAWMKPTANGASMAFIGSRTGTGAGADYTFDAKLYVDPTTKVRSILTDIGDGAVWLRPSFKAPYDWQAGRWLQVGVSVDDVADTVAIYVDGALVSSGPFTTAGSPRLTDAARVLRIGSNGRASVTPEYFDGSIDEVVVYKAALDRSQMANLYASGRSIAVVDQATSYDSLGHPVQTTDQFLANPGFEDGIASGWRSTGATFETTTVHTGGLGSLKLAAAGKAIQERTLVPGQTFRFQGWNQVAGAGQAKYTLEYWKRSNTPGWVAIANMASTYLETSWASHAWDVPLPMDTDGRVRVTVSNVGGSGSVYFDDIALFTTFAQMTYGGTGLIETTTTLSPAGGGGVVVNNPVYASSAVNPAIFATSVIVNDVGTVNDLTSEDLTTTTTYDAWGRALVTTDPDGVTSTDHYKAAGQGNGAMTDRDTVSDGAGNPTTTTYDLVGNALTVQLPLGQTTTTRYDALNHPIDVVTPDTIKTTYQYDLVGQRIAVIANDVPGTPTALDDVVTAYEYDAFGRVIKTTGDDGGIEAVSESTYDLLGNVLTSTVWPGSGGTGTPRVTTSDFASANGLSRAVPTGVKLPVTSTTGHACPSGSGTCNSVSVLDMNGRTVAARDAYDNLTVTRLDLAGRAVQTIVNYVDGAGGTGEPDSDLVTSTTYGPTGLATSVTDPAARTTTTAYDAVGRPNRVTDVVSSRYAKTVYRPSGRVDRVSDARTTDGALVWTKSIYDGAGRVTKTLAHYDTSGEAQITADNFEDGDEVGWASSGDFLSAGSTLTAQLGVTSPSPNSGEGRLKVVTGSGANAGAVWTLSGTYQSTDTYKATAWVHAPVGTTINAYLGTNTDSDTSTSIAGTGTWQALTVTWTPATNQTVAYLAYKRVGSASSVSVYLDDVTVWNASAAAQNALGPDTNIPTETVYDANSRIIRSIVIGGAPGDASLVTATGYDAMSRVTSVTVNDVAGGGTTGAVNLTSTTAYDALGRVSDTFDATSTQTKYAYDRLGRTVATTANYLDGASSGPTGADDLKSTFAYDAVGELTAYCPATAVVADACNPTQTVTTGNDYKSAWHYTYDAMGRMASQVAPVNVTATPLDTTVWAYQTGGRLDSVTDQSPTLFPTIGRHVDMAYDDVGRVISSVVYAGSGTGSPKQTTTTTYAVDGSPTQTAWNGTNDGLDSHTLDFTYTGQGWLDQIKVGATAMTDYGYDSDGSVTSRVDTNPVSTGTTYTTGFTYDWAQRVKAVTAGSIYATSADFAYRFDGLIASRTFPNGETLTFAYDTARRPTTITKANGNTFSQTYDRDSNVLTEARSLTGPTGDNGTNTNTMTYDGLGRLLSESGLGSSRSYLYDRDGNRTRKVEGGTTTIDYSYDRTDQLTKQKINGGADITFAYDRYGNLTTNRDSAGTATTYAYDTASHLTSITAGAQGSTFKFDALGRYRERTVNGVTEKYAYVGTSEVTSVITGTTTRISAVTEDGSRIATKDGSTSAFLIPDLHGNVAAMEQAGAVTIANAIRYDAYGQTMGTPYTGTGSVKLDTKYQGRLDISPSTTPLYDMSARFYSPGIGAFTQLDSYAGSAQNPATMNRFLYALGNPASLIDPTGHYAEGQICNLGPDDCGAITWVPRSDGGGGGASGPHQPSQSQASGIKDDGSSPTTVHTPNQGGFDPGNLVGGIAGGAWDSVSNAAIGTVGGTWHVLTCGGINMFSPICADAEDNLHRLADPAYGKQRSDEELVALLLALQAAGDNLTSGDPYRVSRAVTDIMLVVAVPAKLGAGKMLGRGKAPATGTGTTLGSDSLDAGMLQSGVDATHARFVATEGGVILDTASPLLRTQIEKVVGSIRETGAPPTGVGQGGSPGYPGVFANREGALPLKDFGYYMETDIWEVSAFGGRGTERLVLGRGGEVWYSPDHYGTFRPWVP